MARRTEILVCGFCGCRNVISEQDLGHEEYECSECECMIQVPATFEEFTAYNEESEAELTLERQAGAATHVRIMARGEDGTEFCVKNMISKTNDLLELALAGVRQAYPEATIWLEDEETTSVNYMRSLLRNTDYDSVYP